MYITLRVKVKRSKGCHSFSFRVTKKSGGVGEIAPPLLQIRLLKYDQKSLIFNYY